MELQESYEYFTTFFSCPQQHKVSRYSLVLESKYKHETNPIPIPTATYFLYNQNIRHTYVVTGNDLSTCRSTEINQ